MTATDSDRGSSVPGDARARSASARRRCTRWRRAERSPASPSTRPGCAALAERVLRVTRAAYPDRAAPSPITAAFATSPPAASTAWRALDARLTARSLSPDERLCAKLELAITSVLLDAGAGERWRIASAGGETYARSEGLAVASYHLFASGALSDDPARAPFRADAGALARFSEEQLARAFQVGPDNPLVGLDGRAAILRRLGEVVARLPAFFGAEAPRLGDLGMYLASRARARALPATDVLEAVLEAPR